MSSADTYATIVVGTDGSETSLRAVDHAARLAATSGARLVIATAYQPLGDDEVNAAAVALKDDAYLVHGSAPAETLLADAAARARRGGALEVDTRALRGDPVAVLHQVVTDTHADLLVIGDVGLNTWSGRAALAELTHHRCRITALLITRESPLVHPLRLTGLSPGWSTVAGLATAPKSSPHSEPETARGSCSTAMTGRALVVLVVWIVGILSAGHATTLWPDITAFNHPLGAHGMKDT